MVLGVGLALAVGVVVYIVTRDEEQEAGVGKAVQTPPISLSPPPRPSAPVETKAPSPDVLMLALKADPARFLRGQPGTIRAQTLPGAACTIDAVYSTRRRPGSLDTAPVTVGEDGTCLWTWDIGTGGSYVDVTVWARLAGCEDAEASLRVDIED
jgi:hypothetical protein